MSAIFSLDQVLSFFLSFFSTVFEKRLPTVFENGWRTVAFFKTFLAAADLCERVTMTKASKQQVNEAKGQKHMHGAVAHRKVHDAPHENTLDAF